MTDIEQYCNFITSCLNNGSYDAIVSYEEWLYTVRSYTPEQVKVESNMGIRGNA